MTTIQEAKPSRTVAGGAMFLAMALAPVAALIAMAAWDPHANGPAGLVRAIVNGLGASATASVGVAAWLSGFLFSLWLMVSEHMRASAQPAAPMARWRSSWMEVGRTALVVAGGGLIVYGGLSLLHCGLTAMRPDLGFEAQPPFSFAASIPCLAIGGAAYALGRFGR